MNTLPEMLQKTIQSGASDLHVTTGTPAQMRVDGQLRPIDDQVLNAADTKRLAYSVMTDSQKHLFEEKWEIDFSFGIKDLCRFRANVFTQSGSVAAVFRLIPFEIKGFESLNLPPIVENLCEKPRGLILVTGPTGSGKSTTLAAMVDKINTERQEHILTIEDPIEFVFTPKNSIISQREMGFDTHSWQIALRSVLREDPNVVLVGEMRDHETISSALTVAETGHLVFATLHTNSAAQTIDRIVDVFPEEQQGQVKLQLSNVIEAVFSMRLVPSVSGKRVVAYEVMLGTSAIKTSIREGKTHQIDNVLQTSTEVGMNTLEMSLANLVKAGKINLEIAQTYSLRPEELSRLVRSSKR